MGGDLVFRRRPCPRRSCAPAACLPSGAHVAMALVLLFAREPSAKLYSAAKKEKEVVSLICHGYRNKEIAQKLDISEQTVKSHCNRIYKKVGVTDRLQLALYTNRLWPGSF